ncbi:MAG: ABC transporter permease [Ilumatobacteraceae bacterium]
MSRNLPVRFWFEAITGAVGFALFILTLITREWIEELIGWDPDGGSGSLEIALAVGLLAIAAVSMLAARRDYQRAAIAG